MWCANRGSLQIRKLENECRRDLWCALDGQKQKPAESLKAIADCADSPRIHPGGTGDRVFLLQDKAKSKPASYEERDHSYRRSQQADTFFQLPGIFEKPRRLPASSPMIWSGQLFPRSSVTKKAGSNRQRPICLSLRPVANQSNVWTCEWPPFMTRSHAG